MFTGIVEEVGTVEATSPRLVVGCRTVAEDSPVGASIAVQGVCLTVADRRNGTLAFDLSAETMQRSSLGTLSPGDGVNLERPATLATRLGGHLVQGHVDGRGTVVALLPEEGGATLEVRPPAELMLYLVEKGSVAVDGVSLTVATLRHDSFTVALIPHTLSATTLGGVRSGDPVNVEVDVVAKYVEGFMRRTE